MSVPEYLSNGADNNGPAPASDALRARAPLGSNGSGHASALTLAPAHKAAGADALGLLKALKRRWVLALCLGVLLGACAAVGVWFFLPPPKETAYAKLLVMDRSGEVIFQHPEANTDFQTYLRTQVAYLRGWQVISKALNDPKVKNFSFVREHLPPEDWLIQRLKIDFTEGPQIPRISLTLDNPEEALAVVKAITDVYFDEVVNKEKNKRRDRLDHLNEVGKVYEKRVKEIKETIRELSKGIGTNDARNAQLIQENILRELRITQEDLTKVTAKIRWLRIVLPPPAFVSLGAGLFLPRALVFREESIARKTHDSGAAKVPEQVIEESISRDPRIQELSRAIVNTESTLKQARKQFVQKDDPAVRRFESQLETQKDSLEAARKELRPAVEAALRNKLRETARHDLDSAREEITTLEALKKALKGDVDRLENAAKQVNEGSLNLDDFKDEREQAAKMAARIADERDKLQVDLDAPSRVKVLEEARIERVEETPRKLRFAGLAALGGLAVTLLAVAFLEFRRRRLDSPETASRELGIQIVGTVPACPFNNRRLLARDSKALTYWQHLLTDSIDAARTLLINRAGRGELKTIMIASAVSGEGKTSLTSHLAVSMARAGFNTLVVDGDLRNPAMHELFEQALQPGLCESIQEECELAEACRPTSVEGLSLLSAGQCSAPALRCLAQGKARALFSQLKQQYDFIIVDSSPLLPVADALLFAQHVDGVLFSMLCEVSCLPRLQEACNRLAILGVPILGAVVSGTVVGGSTYGTQYVYSTNQ